MSEIILIGILTIITIIYVMNTAYYREKNLELSKGNDKLNYLNETYFDDFEKYRNLHINRLKEEEVLKNKIISLFENNIEKAKIKQDSNAMFGIFYVVKFKDYCFHIYKRKIKEDTKSIHYMIEDKFLITPYLEECHYNIIEIVTNEFNKREEFKRLSEMNK